MIAWLCAARQASSALYGAVVPSSLMEERTDHLGPALAMKMTPSRANAMSRLCVRCGARCQLSANPHLEKFPS